MMWALKKQLSNTHTWTTYPLYPCRLRVAIFCQTCCNKNLCTLPTTLPVGRIENCGPKPIVFCSSHFGIPTKTIATTGWGVATSMPAKPAFSPISRRVCLVVSPHRTPSFPANFPIARGIYPLHFLSPILPSTFKFPVPQVWPKNYHICRMAWGKVSSSPYGANSRHRSFSSGTRIGIDHCSWKLLRS